MRKNVEIARLLGWRLWASADNPGAAKLRFPGESAPEGYTEDVTADVDRWGIDDYFELPDCYTSVDAAIEHLIAPLLPLLPNVVIGFVPISATSWQVMITQQDTARSYSSAQPTLAAAICEAWLQYKREAGQS